MPSSIDFMMYVMTTYPSYYICCLQEDTSLAKVYTLFRSLGLRHLAVIPRASNVVGIITRHDLLSSRMEATALEQITLGAGETLVGSNCMGLLASALHPIDSMCKKG